MTRFRLTATAVALVALALPSAAAAADRDHDKMRDSWEKHYKLNTHKNDARKDRDRDGLKNIQEYRAGTNPVRKDSDRDGIRDDDEGAGTIKSYDPASGELVIDLFASDTDLTGKVDGTTKIECEGDDDAASGDDSSQSHSRDGQSGDDQAEHQSGDDQAEHQSGDDDQGGDDQGDDDRSGDQPAQPACDANSLAAGQTVKEAKLNEGDDGPAGVFHEIEVVR